MTKYPLLPLRLWPGGGAALSPAKINLFLEVLRRRPDGYHDIHTVFLPMAWFDCLILTPGVVEDRLEVRGERVVEGPENLVLRALALLREHAEVPPLRLALMKRIPPGSGLGGGSGNAAALLVLVDRVFRLGLGEAKLRALAARLGSDVPFFLGRGLAVGTGRGEILREIPGPALGGDRPCFLIVRPGVTSSTREVYEGLSFPLTSPNGPITVHERTFATSRRWVERLFNRLEAPVLTRHEVLRKLARWLDREARGRWRMTGSGSVFYVVCFDLELAGELEARLRAECSVQTRRVWPIFPGD